MFARVVTFQRSSAASCEEARRRAEAEVLPLIQQQPGYRGMYVLVDRASGKQVGISFWDTEEQANGSTAHNAVRDRTSRELGDTAAPRTELFEVDFLQQPTMSPSAERATAAPC